MEMIGRFLLFLTGWRYQSEIFSFQRRKRVILVFSHSSMWDVIIFVIYLMSRRDLFDTVYTIMKPQPFQRFGKWLKMLHFIPATRLENTGQGFVKSISDLTKDLAYFHLMISPKGTIEAAKWRSGYYYLAKELKADLQVIGLDYRERRIKTGSLKLFENLGDREILELVLKEEMSDITPLNTYKEVSKISGLDLYPVDYLTLSSFIFGIYPLMKLFFFDLFIFALALMSVIYSIRLPPFHRE